MHNHPLRARLTECASPLRPRTAPGAKPSPAASPATRRDMAGFRDMAAAVRQDTAIHRWPVVCHPPRASEGVAACIMKREHLPLRCIAADDRLVYVAEAPCRAPSGGGQSHNGRLCAREPREGKLVKHVPVAGTGGAPSCLLATSDGNVWCGNSDGLLHVCRRGGPPLHEARAHAAAVAALAEATESVWSAGPDFLVRVWSMSLVPLRTLRGHTGAICALAAVAVAPGRCEVWSAGADRCARVWSCEEAAGYPQLARLGEEAAPTTVLVAHDGVRPPRIWSGDASGGLRVFDAAGRAVLRCAVGGGGDAPAITCIACNAVSVWVGDEAGTLRVYDARSTSALGRFDGAHAGPVAGLAAPSGRRGGVTRSGDGCGVVVWSFGAHDEVVRGWGMAEHVLARIERMRRAVEAQHQAVELVQATLLRATATCAGRVEAAAVRGAALRRRVLDLEVAITLGGGPEAGRTDGVGAALGAGAALDGGGQKAEYEAALAAVGATQCEVASEVEQALLALRTRVDQLLTFAQGHRQASHEAGGAQANGDVAKTQCAPAPAAPAPKPAAALPPSPPTPAPVGVAAAGAADLDQIFALMAGSN